MTRKSQGAIRIGEILLPRLRDDMRKIAAMSDADFDFQSYDDYTNRGPKRPPLEEALTAWKDSFSRVEGFPYDILTTETALEYARLLFSHPPLLEAARQMARNAQMSRRLQAEGMTREEAAEAASKAVPWGNAAARLYEFGEWFKYKRDLKLHPLRGFRFINDIFWKMVDEGVSHSDAEVLARIKKRKDLKYLIPELAAAEDNR